jgi:hypothetical protein
VAGRAAPTRAGAMRGAWLLAVTSLVLALVATPLDAEAQQAAKVPRVGILCALTCLGEGTLPEPSENVARSLFVRGSA